MNNTGNYNTGNYNTGNCNTGDWNTENYNTGDCNRGGWNTGDYNTGNYNTGDCNRGGWNTGNYNTGNWNTGDWNTGDCNRGCFNTITPSKLLIFNKECDREIWEKVTKPTFLFFNLTEWVYANEMTEEEKQEHKEWETTGGYLKQLNYKDAFQQSFYGLSEEERTEQVKQLKALPNFDSKVFYEISGIDIDKSVVKEMTVDQISKELGYTVKVIGSESVTDKETS